jgi:hypothetical protein
VKLFTCELGFKKTNGVQFKFANQKLLCAKGSHIPSSGTKIRDIGGKFSLGTGLFIQIRMAPDLQDACARAA